MYTVRIRRIAVTTQHPRSLSFNIVEQALGTPSGVEGREIGTRTEAVRENRDSERRSLVAGNGLARSLVSIYIYTLRDSLNRYRHGCPAGSGNVQPEFHGF